MTRSLTRGAPGPRSRFAVTPSPRSAVSSSHLGFDVNVVREDFPMLHTRIHDNPLVYLDNAATTQKPQVVIDRLMHYYTDENANVHRGVHLLSERATEAYEEARRTVCRFLNAADPNEIVFVRGTTEAINLVAHSYGRRVRLFCIRRNVTIFQ